MKLTFTIYNIPCIFSSCKIQLIVAIYYFVMASDGCFYKKIEEDD
ncbi:hypothetical protein [Bacteroides sp.]|nr:hypothetical protein [Bacteroides sp.]MDD3038061.1 hypothetical protein [Bacteroides sp.]